MTLLKDVLDVPGLVDLLTARRQGFATVRELAAIADEAGLWAWGRDPARTGLDYSLRLDGAGLGRALDERYPDGATLDQIAALADEAGLWTRVPSDSAPTVLDLLRYRAVRVLVRHKVRLADGRVVRWLVVAREAWPAGRRRLSYRLESLATGEEFLESAAYLKERMEARDRETERVLQFGEAKFGAAALAPQRELFEEMKRQSEEEEQRRLLGDD
jgi:hypothetical protein